MLKIVIYGLFISLFSSVSYATDWPSKFYNPKPSKDDVILPMPCDGFLVMKKIYTPNRKALEDTKIVLGSNQKELGFAEFATPTYIAGSFANQDNERYFMLAKYELTSLQYQAVMDDKCPVVQNTALFPVTNVSWFDAISFTEKYTRWLLEHLTKKNNKDLPKGYVRLPTNTEWEFAVRGGVKVTESEFRAPRFPMPTNRLENYAWFSGVKSSNGKLQLIGMLEPNTLDLYDMLGNVNEMMFDSFQMNKLDRYHGQQGAMVVRGGSYLTPETSITSSYRIEKPYYTDQSVLKSKDIGFRIVFTQAVINDIDTVQELDKQWNQLGNETASNENKVVNELEKITSQVDDEKTKQELKRLNNLLRSANQARDEQRNSSLQSALQLGAFLCANVSDLDDKFSYNDNLYYVMTTEICDINEADKLDANNMCSTTKLKNLEKTREESQKARDFILKYYSDMIVNTASNYEQKLIQDQFKPTKFKLENSGKANMTGYLGDFLSHINQYNNSGKIEKNNWLASCKKVKGE